MNRIKSQDKYDLNAVSRIDEYFATVLDCHVNDLRAPGWTPLVSHSENDPATLLFGMRQVVYLLAPACLGSDKAGPAGVALLASELRNAIGSLLNTAMPEEFFQPALLARLDRLVRASVTRPLAPGCEPRLSVFYVSQGSFRPYIGRWVEWIERLDESTETDPFALALLARHGGGVFVVRHRGSIAAYIGLRAYSLNVWELTAPRMTASIYASYFAQPGDLFAALISRATRAAIESDHIPICTLSARESALRKALSARGYHYYAHASAYATTMP